MDLAGEVRVAKLNRRSVCRDETPSWLSQRLEWAERYRRVVEERDRLQKENEALKSKRARRSLR